MTQKRLAVGREGEAIAAEYLLDKGYVLLVRNYSCPLGEIDLVVREQDTLVFVEVRTKTGASFGLPQESINNRKQQKLRQLAWYYLKATKQENSNCRFDVMAVTLNRQGKKVRVEHIIDAF